LGGHRRAVSAAVVAGFAVGNNVVNVGAVASALADAYGVSLAVVGLFSTALFLTHTGVQVPGGQAIDRFGARRMLVAALTVVVAGNGFALIASEPWLALVARAFMGVGTGVAFISASEYVRAAGGSHVAQGWFGGIGVGGGAFALAVVPQLEKAADWRAPYLLAGALTAIALVSLVAAPLQAGAGRMRSPSRTTAFQVLGDRRLYRIAAMHTAAFGLSVVAGNWTVTLLEHHGYSTGLASTLGAMTLGVSVVSRPLGGWILRRDAESIRLACGVSLAAGAAASAGLAASGPVALAAVSAAVLGFASGIPFAPAFAGAARARPDAPGAAVGLVNMSGGLMNLAATPLVGLTFSLPGDGRIGFVALAVLWAGALLVLPAREVLSVRS
jgi:MFS family permease